MGKTKLKSFKNLNKFNVKKNERYKTLKSEIL